MAELIEVGKILQDTEARADHLTVALNAIKGLKTKRPGKVAEAMAKVAEEALG